MQKLWGYIRFGSQEYNTSNMYPDGAPHCKWCNGATRRYVIHLTSGLPAYLFHRRGAPALQSATQPQKILHTTIQNIKENRVVIIGEFVTSKYHELSQHISSKFCQHSVDYRNRIDGKRRLMQPKTIVIVMFFYHTKRL
jgi:hypothetical protein